MTYKEVVKKYFDRPEADYMLYNFECKLCNQLFEPDTLLHELVTHLQTSHPTLKEFK